jgi:CRP/FNR family transcriptional regulator
MYALTHGAANGQHRVPPYSQALDSPDGFMRVSPKPGGFGLTRQGTREAIGQGAPARFRKGQTILCEGDPADRCFEVVRGVARAYRVLPDGRRQIVDFLFPGEILGFGLEGTYEYSADAVTEASVQGFGRAAVDQLNVEQPALAARLRDSIYRELRAAQDHIVLLGRKTASERVASFFLALARKSGTTDHDAGMIWVPMSQCDIADYLGLTTETVNRVMSQLRESGTISAPSRGLVHVNQPRDLEEIANAA